MLLKRMMKFFNTYLTTKKNHCMMVVRNAPIFVRCLKLLNLNANDRWSDTSFTSLLEFLNDMLPEDNEIPVSTYKANKLFWPMGMEIERIHGCPNDCMLYRNEYSNLHNCITCVTSLYKSKNHTNENNNTSKNGSSAKVLWCLPKNHIMVSLKKYEN